MKVKKNDLLETCGIIMPISTSDDYSAAHWADVKDIIEECIIDAGFKPQLVSDSTDTGIIHQRIVENIYANPIVVCDISSRNPNVMFELGIRLTFDKPAVIIKDDETDRIFDTDIIEYIQYPKNLRYANIQNFKKKLTDKIKATYEKYKDPSTSFFIRHFKNVKLQKLQDEELGSTELILRAIEDIKRDVVNVKRLKPGLKITDALLLETLLNLLTTPYEESFKALKTKDPITIFEVLETTFRNTILKDQYTIPLSYMKERLANLYHVINDNDTFETVKQLLSQ